MGIEDLSAPFDPRKVSWRVGSTTGDKKRGMALAYIDARDVMARLDEVLGAGGWQDRYEFHGPRTICYLTVKVDGEWVTKADGAGDSDVEAEKGAISDAFKRAAVKWGIGRYLYDIDSPWVELEAHGRSYSIAKGEYARLARLLPGSIVKAPQQAAEPVGQPQEANPFDEDRNAIDALMQNMRLAESVEGLRKWYKLQLPAINELPSDQRGEFDAAAKVFQDELAARSAKAA